MALVPAAPATPASPVGAMGASFLSSAVGAFIASANAKASANWAYAEKAAANIDINKAIAETNLQNTIRTGYKAGILNIQRGQARQAATQSAFDITKVSKQVLGANAVNAAASGTVGASVDAVANDIRKKMDEASIAVDENLSLTEQNYNTQLNDLITAGQDSLQHAAKIGYAPRGPSTGAQVLGALANTGTQFATQYALSNMSLGLGRKST